MNHDDKLFDILLINNNEAVVDIFQILTKKFKLTLKIAKNTQEFVDYSKMYDFHYILSDLHLDYKFEGFFIARLFSTIKKVHNGDGQIILLSSENLSKDKLENFNFDGSVSKNFAEIYKFLVSHFKFKTFTEEFGLTNQQEIIYAQI